MQDPMNTLLRGSLGYGGGSKQDGQQSQGQSQQKAKPGALDPEGLSKVLDPAIQNLGAVLQHLQQMQQVIQEVAGEQSGGQGAAQSGQRSAQQ